MNFNEIERTSQLAATNAAYGSPRLIAHNEALAIMQRPGITTHQAAEELMGLRGKYLGWSRAARDEYQEHYYAIYSVLLTIGQWLETAAKEEEQLYGDITPLD